MGAVTLNVPAESPAFGKAYPCPCGYIQRLRSGTFMAKREERLSKALPESHRHITFETWDNLPTNLLKGKETALQACKELAKKGHIGDENNPKVGVVLSGPPGIGKTSMAVALVNALLANHVGCWWVDYNDFLDNIQDTYADDYRGPSKIKLVKDASQVPVLVLDDMGDYQAKEQKLSDDKRNITYSLIRDRYHSHGITIIPTNLNRAAFTEMFGRRIARRVEERYLWIDMTGADLSADRIKQMIGGEV